MKLEDYRETRIKGELVFPNSRGRPNMHLVRIVQEVAKRAGIEKRVTLHQFRRTFGSMMAKKHSIQVAQKLLGHADIKTTALYLAADEEDMKQVKAGAAETFAEYVGK